MSLKMQTAIHNRNQNCDSNFPLEDICVIHHHYSWANVAMDSSLGGNRTESLEELKGGVEGNQLD